MAVRCRTGAVPERKRPKRSAPNAQFCLFLDGDSNLRRRALNNNLPLAPTSQSQKQRGKTANGRTQASSLSSSSAFGRKTNTRTRDQDRGQEEMPEWMDEGPQNHNEVIPLGGFEEHEKNWQETRPVNRKALSRLFGRFLPLASRLDRPAKREEGVGRGRHALAPLLRPRIRCPVWSARGSFT